jgi:hypothetical protein
MTRASAQHVAGRTLTAKLALVALAQVDQHLGLKAALEMHVQLRLGHAANECFHTIHVIVLSMCRLERPNGGAQAWGQGPCGADS